MAWPLRAWAFLFNVAVGLFLLGVAAVSGGQHNIQLWAAPLEGAALTRQLWIGGTYALASTLLALGARGWQRLPMLLWNLGIPISIVWSVQRAGFRFESPGQALNGLYVFLAALMTLAGSWLHFRRRARPAESPR